MKRNQHNLLQTRFMLDSMDFFPSLKHPNRYSTDIGKCLFKVFRKRLYILWYDLNILNPAICNDLHVLLRSFPG